MAHSMTTMVPAFRYAWEVRVVVPGCLLGWLGLFGWAACVALVPSCLPRPLTREHPSAYGAREKRHQLPLAFFFTTHPPNERSGFRISSLDKSKDGLESRLTGHGSRK